MQLKLYFKIDEIGKFGGYTFISLIQQITNIYMWALIIIKWQLSFFRSERVIVIKRYYLKVNISIFVASIFVYVSEVVYY